MIKIATPLEEEVSLINEKIRQYLNLPNLAPISVNERIIAIYDDASNDFMVAEFGLFNEKLPTETPFWRVLCFRASLTKIKLFVKTLALELQARKHSTTPVYWQPQLNILREQAVNFLFSPEEKIIDGKKFWEITAAKTLTKL